MFRDKFNRSGFTIMELLVTAAIIAVVVHFAGRITFDSYLGINKLDNSSLRTEAAKYLMETVDCTKSFVATGSQRTCKTAGPKVLKDKGGNTIVANIDQFISFATREPKKIHFKSFSSRDIFFNFLFVNRFNALMSRSI